MTRPKKPIVATIHAVKITRDGEYAIIDYKDSKIGGINIKIGAEISSMTDQDILNLHNRIINDMEESIANYKHIAVEIPPGKPQVEYHDRSDQWVPRGDVLRCLIHDAEKGKLVVEIDGRDFSLEEFGRMLSTWAGWGMRIVCVPDNEIEKVPVIEVKDAEK